MLYNPVRYAFVLLEGPVVLFDFHNCEHLSDGIETIDEVRPACGWDYLITGDGPVTLSSYPFEDTFL